MVGNIPLARLGQLSWFSPLPPPCDLSQPPCCSPIIFPCCVSMKKLFWENIWILLMGNVTSEGKFVKVTILKFFFAQKEMELWRGKKYTTLSNRKTFHFLHLTTKMTNPYDISITVAIKRSPSGQLASKQTILSLASNSTWQTLSRCLQILLLQNSTCG